MSILNERIEKFKAAVARVGFVNEAVKNGRQFNAYESTTTGDDDDCPVDEREFYFAIGPITDFNTLTYLYGKDKADLFESAFKLAQLVAYSEPSPCAVDITVDIQPPADPAEAMFKHAVRITSEEKRVSCSLLQRRLRIGFNSAARLIEQMQAEGLVSRPDCTGRRTIICLDTLRTRGVE